MAEHIPALPEQLYAILQNEKFVLLNTLDVETGAPNVHAITWMYAKDPETLHFADDARFRIVSTRADVDVHSVQDVMFYGARIVTEPEYEKTYDIRAAEKLNGQVFDAMKKA